MHAIFTTVRGIVDTRQFLFDDLWKRSMPAEDRIKEIEEGVTPDTIEIFNDASEIINIAYRFVSAAKDEILIIFHTSNALVHQEKAGGLDSPDVDVDASQAQSQSQDNEQSQSQSQDNEQTTTIINCPPDSRCVIEQ